MGDNLNGIFANMIQGMGFIGCAPNRVYNMAPPDGGGVEATAEGTEFTLHSAAAPLAALTLYGKSEQRTTTGAQLANFPDVQEVEINGITWSCENGVIHASGTTTDDKYSVFNSGAYVLPVVAGTYYVSSNSDSVEVYVSVRKNEATQYYKNSSFALDGTETECKIYAQVSPGKTVDETAYPMLNSGSTALPWEPYTGGAPSPSPDYPQEIKSVGDSGEIDVRIAGAQLFDASTMVYDGAFTSTSINDVKEAKTAVIPIEPGVEYSISRGNIEGNFFRFVQTSFNENITKLSDITTDTFIDGTFFNDSSLSKYIITANSNAKYLLIYFWSVGSEYTLEDILSVLMVNAGSTVLPWEPYRIPQTLPVQTPNGLPGIPVDSGGNYTDASGQQWVCDEVDFERGMYVQRCAKYTPTGDETMSGPSTSQGVDEYSIAFESGVDQNSTNFGISNKFKCKNRFEANTFTVTNMFIYIRFAENTQTLETAREVLNGCEFWYILATPVETPLSLSDLAAYAALRTYSPTTVVSNDAGAWMKVGYKATPQPMTMLARKR